MIGLHINAKKEDLFLKEITEDIRRKIRKNSKNFCK